MGPEWSPQPSGLQGRLAVRTGTNLNDDRNIKWPLPGVFSLVSAAWVHPFSTGAPKVPSGNRAGFKELPWGSAVVSALALDARVAQETWGKGTD